MQVQIDGSKTINFTAQGISYVLDMLANCPWKMANPLINDIMSQLKAQEAGEQSGASRHSTGSAGGRDPSDWTGGLPPVEAE